MSSPAELDHLQFFRMQCLRDTGYLCRHLLGWNYDIDAEGNKCNIGTGGVRAEGTHQKMVDFVDDRTKKFKVLLAPRKSYKSTIAQGFVLRHILLNPNVRILYGTKTDDKAAEFALAIRNALELPRVQELFGEQVGFPWETTRFTVAGRTQTHLTSPTFRTFSLESIPTGGRGDIIIVDDLIDQDSVKTPESMEWAKKISRMLFPMREAGAITLYLGTRYGDKELYDELLRNDLYDSLVLGAGVRVVKEAGGKIGLEVLPGGITFPHLSLDYLKQALKGMSSSTSWFDFSCQYLNEVPVGLMSPFRREYFKPLRWDDSMIALSGYMLTDTATSLKEDGCYSVIAYMGLDAHDNFYLLDCRVGHWRPAQFVDEYFSMLGYWQNRVNHCGEVWEKVALASVFRYAIEADQRSTKIRAKTIEITRAGNTDSLRKKVRIERLEKPMHQGRFFVVNTVPQHFTDAEGQKLLYHPESYKDPKTGVSLPEGELVDEFLRLGVSGQKNDIADALAMVMEIDPKTQRAAVTFRKPSQALRERAGLTQYDEPQQHPDPRAVFQQDWWRQTLRSHGRPS